MLILSRNNFLEFQYSICGEYRAFWIIAADISADAKVGSIEHKNADELVFITNSSALLVRYLSAGCKRLWTCYSEYFIVSEEEGLQRK